MIRFDEKENVFILETQNTGYVFQCTTFGHLEHIYYGTKLNNYSIDSLRLKRTATVGSSIVYNQDDPLYCLDLLALEWSGIGRGDYRYSPAEIKMPDGSFVCDFQYQSHTLHDHTVVAQTLPTAYSEDGTAQTLEITLSDESNNTLLTLYYTVFEESNVITRRAMLKNCNQNRLTMRRLLSMSLDMPNRSFEMITFDGGWIKETHRHDRRIQIGMTVNASTTGASSNKHNAGFLLATPTATEETGEVYGFNLVYSGNHMGVAELSDQQTVRVLIGINPHCFEWELSEGEFFETPEAVMTYSANGYNGMSANFHSFINANIVRGDWKGKERPVLLNNWEAHFFKFSESKLFHLAKSAKKLGVELFVLDDGWFEGRNSDTAGLGDYAVNRKKLPRGIAHFSRRVRKLGMSFGLWFEPEMVNTASRLYAEHPEFAVTLNGKAPTLGRNQLVLDLCNPDCRDYIVRSVSQILDEADISYVKWDMNRHISESVSSCISNQGEFFHRYIMGLYDILSRIFRPRPHILLESCSSGGNRFDLGMLCFSPQIWASDNTDAIERLDIVSGLSYLYPPSAIGAHVSEAPHQQTLRQTPLSTRFNVSCFGCLGYELDLKYLTAMEKKEVSEQIAFYKKHRKTLQYGRFSRVENSKTNKVGWQSTSPDGSTAIAGFFQKLATAAESPDVLRVQGLQRDTMYSVSTKPQRLFIRRFGGLLKHILPIELNPDGFVIRTVNRFYALVDCVETYQCDGATLWAGIHLNNQFMGSYYNNKTRLLGDYGSSLYVIENLK